MKHIEPDGLAGEFKILNVSKRPLIHSRRNENEKSSINEQKRESCYMREEVVVSCQ